MAEEEGSEESCKCPPGAPGWITTFSDLMSLLLAFFVLLFSFSELDKAVYKEVGGSLKNAFGVQMEIMSKDPLKGINFIATEFSPGRPDPTALNEIRQETTNVLLRYLLAKNSKTGENQFEMKKVTAEEVVRKVAEIVAEEADEITTDDQAAAAIEQALEVLESVAKQLSSQAEERFEEGGLLIGDESGGGDGEEDLNAETIVQEVEDFFQIQEDVLTQLQVRDKEQEGDTLVAKMYKDAVDELAKEGDSNVEVAREVLQEFLKSAGERRQEDDAFTLTEEAIRKKLKKEIAEGILELVSDKDQEKVTLYIKEKSSFDSASAELKPEFKPVIVKIGDVISKMQGIISVSGHTDDRPIQTARFRSNWELSASRAVSVTHALLETSKILPQRFQVRGHADTIPRDTNKTKEGRAKNRRVEISVIKARLTNEALQSMREEKVDMGTASTTSLLKPRNEKQEPASQSNPTQDKSEAEGQVDAKPGDTLSVQQIENASPEDLGEFSVEYEGRPSQLGEESSSGEGTMIFKPFEIF